MVCAYYAHVSTGHGHSGCYNSESVEHKAAKHIISHLAHQWKFYYNCRDCGEKQHVSVGGVDDVFSEEVRWKEFSLDVGVKNQSGEVVGAVEVVKTHPCTQKKLDEFFNGNIGWVEVQAKKVLQAHKDGIYEVEVNICQHFFCENCRSKIKKRKLEEEEEKFNEKFARRFIDLSDKQKQKIEEEAVAEFIQGKANVMKGIENELKESYTKELTEVGCSFAKQAFKICYDIKPGKAPLEIQNFSVLTHNMMKNLLEMCSEMGVTKEQFVDHSYSLLDPDATILNFGQFSGHTLEQLEENNQWWYIVRLAGFNGNKVGKRPEPADPKYFSRVPKEIVKKAREMIKGRCYKCGEETDEDWKHWCRECFRCRH